jgi:uncharacterized protein YaiE (UPF0345 family)
VVDGTSSDFEFEVSDDRFEIVDGILRLRAGVSVDYEAESGIDFEITATSRTGDRQTLSIHVDVTDVNEAQTDFVIGGDAANENVAGAIIGDLAVADPDASDSPSFQVSDSRFEVVDGQLKLKDGVSLDHESEPVVSLTVTATDSAGHQIEQTVAVTVGDVNEAPTDLDLSANVLVENVAGAVIGTLSAVDPDAGDSHTFELSDSRFEVVNGQLKLKDGIALDFETEPSLNVIVIATDSAGNNVQENFSLSVADANEAPSVTGTDGAVVNHIVDTSESYDPQSSGAVGDYLHGNNGSPLSMADISSSVSTEDLTVFATTPVTVTFQKEGAGYRNMVGVYQFDGNGDIIPGTIEFVWLDATANSENTVGASLGNDFLGYSQPSSVFLGTLPEGTHLGFFMIANGASNSANRTLLTDAAAGAGTQHAALDAIAGQLSIRVDANGNGRVYVGDSQLNGGTYFTHDRSLNTDFDGGSDISHAVAGVSANVPGQLLIGFEDLKGGGDQDYNDLVISVGMGTYNVNKMTQSAVQPTVDFSDVDGSALAKAVIRTSGFQAGDLLNVPPSSDFNVAVGTTGANYDITIVGKTGTETLDQYEAFANAIFFSTSSKIEGDRRIDYTVTDSGGLTSTVSSADIGVSNSYEISSSQLAAGPNTLGSGDDLLHVNGGSIAETDMGDGYDTVHLARNGASFGHDEAVKLANVEAIDASGHGANTVSLSIDDVLNMTDEDNRLTIIGEQGDSVMLTATGSNSWTVVASNAQFTTYAYSDPAMQVVVEISNQLNAQVS